MPQPAKTSRAEILDNALRLLEDEGLSALSMRTLADRVGVRASSLYRHYSSRDGLEQAMADQGFRLLTADLERAVRGHAPGAAMREAARAYMAFAHDRPGLYDLMLAPRAPDTGGPGPEKDLWNLALKVVGEVMGQEDDTAAAVAFWSFLHGYAGLERAGQFGLSGPRGALERGVEALIAGLQRSGGRTPRSVE